MHFADWQSTSDGSELLDPIYAQYREAFVVLEAERDGTLVNFCPFIYVDQDISLMRGWLQGLPKKSGSVWVTRSLPLDHPAAAPLVAGTRLGASLAVKDRRLAEATVTLTGRTAPRLGLLKQPTYGLLGLPTLLGEVATPVTRAWSDSPPIRSFMVTTTTPRPRSRSLRVRAMNWRTSRRDE